MSHASSRLVYLGRACLRCLADFEAVASSGQDPSDSRPEHVGMNWGSSLGSPIEVTQQPDLVPMVHDFSVDVSDQFRHRGIGELAALAVKRFAQVLLIE